MVRAPLSGKTSKARSPETERSPTAESSIVSGAFLVQKLKSKGLSDYRIGSKSDSHGG